MYNFWIIVSLAFAAAIVPSSGTPQSSPTINKLRCKIVSDGTSNCNDVVGRSCDDSQYLEVSAGKVDHWWQCLVVFSPIF
jgi:hypothetical protein